MEGLYPQGQSYLQEENKLFRHVIKTRIIFSSPVICCAVLEIWELLKLLPIPGQVQHLKKQIVF